MTATNYNNAIAMANNRLPRCKAKWNNANPPFPNASLHASPRLAGNREYMNVPVSTDPRAAKSLYSGVSASRTLRSRPTLERENLPSGLRPPSTLLVVVERCSKVAPAERSPERSRPYNTRASCIATKWADVPPNIPPTGANEYPNLESPRRATMEPHYTSESLRRANAEEWEWWPPGTKCSYRKAEYN